MKLQGGSKSSGRVTIKQARKGVVSIRATGKAAEMLFRAFAENLREDKEDKEDKEDAKAKEAKDEK